MQKINVTIAIFVITCNFITNAMLTDTIHAQASSHHQLYDFLPVLNAEQITKLRNIVIGAKSPSAFSDEEINELKSKLQQREKYPR